MDKWKDKDYEKKMEDYTLEMAKAIHDSVCESLDKVFINVKDASDQVGILANALGNVIAHLSVLLAKHAIGDYNARIATRDKFIKHVAQCTINSAKALEENIKDKHVK